MLNLKTFFLTFFLIFTLLLPSTNAWGQPLLPGRRLKSYAKRRNLVLRQVPSGTTPTPIDCNAVCPDPDMKGNPFASAVCTPGNGGNKVKKFECDYTQRNTGAALSCVYDGNGMLTSSSDSAQTRCYPTISG